jgi:hypothetical protein
MKNLFFLTLVMLTLSACTQKENKSISQDELQQTENDSVNNALADSLGQIAWGSAKFGMSVKDVQSIPEYSNLEVERWGDNKQYASIKLPTTDFSIKIGLANLNYIKIQFDNDILNWVEIRSWEKSSLESLIKDCKRLVKLFSETYGEPSSLNEDIYYSDFDTEKNMTFATYSVGDKYISIDVLESSPDEYYYKIVSNNFNY